MGARRLERDDVFPLGAAAIAARCGSSRSRGKKSTAPMEVITPKAQATVERRLCRLVYSLFARLQYLRSMCWLAFDQIAIYFGGVYGVISAVLCGGYQTAFYELNDRPGLHP